MGSVLGVKDNEEGPRPCKNKQIYLSVVASSELRVRGARPETHTQSTARMDR